MSDAGKPIFSRFGTDDEIARQCALFQAIRTAVNGGDKAFELGEIQSIYSQKSLIAFMTVGALTLVSVKSTEEANVEATYARLELENIYAQLIFILTDQVQAEFSRNPSFDLRAMLASSEKNLIRGVLDESGNNPGPFLIASVQTAFPISRKIREKASRALQSSRAPNIAFALLLVGDKLLTIVQSSYRPHQLRVSDLQLIVNFVRKQPYHTMSELWVPMCLPRFNSSGFLYSYIKCLDSTSKLSLILVSSHSTTEQFSLFRTASEIIREDLGVPQDPDSVLTITGDHNGSDIVWERSEESFESEEDYVTIGAQEQLLLEEVRQSCEFSSFDRIAQRYFGEEEPLLHFLFRIDIPIKKTFKNTTHGNGHLPQCISPPMPPSFSGAASRRHLFSIYQQLALRLRLGSATIESSMDAFDMIKMDKSIGDTFPSTTSVCPVLGLMESPPNVHGVTYLRKGKEIFLGMNGRDFEIYFVTSNTIPVKTAAGIGTRLVRRLKEDESKLFLSNPQTWEI